MAFAFMKSLLGRIQTPSFHQSIIRVPHFGSLWLALLNWSTPLINMNNGISVNSRREKLKRTSCKPISFSVTRVCVCREQSVIRPNGNDKTGDSQIFNNYHDIWWNGTLQLSRRVPIKPLFTVRNISGHEESASEREKSKFWLLLFTSDSYSMNRSSWLPSADRELQNFRWKLEKYQRSMTIFVRSRQKTSNLRHICRKNHHMKVHQIFYGRQ